MAYEPGDPPPAGLSEGRRLSPGLPSLPSVPRAPLAVRVEGVRKSFGRYPALDDVSLDVRPGELLALLGPSGSGKTTLLRLIAGLDFPEAGDILFDGADVTFAAAAQRGVGFVFQQYALFRHMTVAQNISFGLDVRKRGTRPSAADRKARVEALLKLVELEGLGHRRPAQLSGGMAMRVSIARSLATSPRLLLMDEPFAALDEITRRRLADDVMSLWTDARPALLFITHSVEEAVYMANRVIVMSPGPGRMVAEARLADGFPRPPRFRTTTAFREAVEEVSQALQLAMEADA